jgi:hypothetical protein
MDAGRQWALETFGEPGPILRNKVIDLVVREHEASAAAQEAWGHDSQLVYGAIWHGLLKSFQELASLPGATMMRPGEAPYRVPVINGTTVYPWRYARNSETDIRTVPFATSPARAAVPDLVQRHIQPSLSPDFEPDLGLTDEDLKHLNVLKAVKDQPRGADRLVVVGVASNPYGLHRVTWGEVTIDADGYPTYIGFVEDLLELGRTGPASMEPGRSFTEGDLPNRKPEIITDDESEDGDA